MQRRIGHPRAATPCRACPLRRLPTFTKLPHDKIDMIQSVKSGELAARAGETIIAPGAEKPELYTLLSGWAFRYKELPDGRRQILNVLLPGDLVGLQSAMFDAAQNGVEALSDAVLCILPRAKVWSLFQGMPDLAFDITWLGSREEMHVDDSLLSVGRRNAAERIAAFIIGLSRRAAALGLADADGSFAFPLQQTHVADAIGLSLVHTSKTLAKLRRLGMFTMANGRLHMANARALARLAPLVDADLAPRPLI